MSLPASLSPLPRAIGAGREAPISSSLTPGPPAPHLTSRTTAGLVFPHPTPHVTSVSGNLQQHQVNPSAGLSCLAGRHLALCSLQSTHVLCKPWVSISPRTSCLVSAAEPLCCSPSCVPACPVLSPKRIGNFSIFIAQAPSPFYLKRTPTFLASSPPSLCRVCNLCRKVIRVMPCLLIFLRIFSLHVSPHPDCALLEGRDSVLYLFLPIISSSWYPTCFP